VNDVPQKCPHCGVVIETPRDAFCPECRGSLDDPPARPAREILDIERPSSPAMWFPLNGSGLVILVLSFLPALVISQMIGDNRDGIRLVIGGPISFMMDLIYRCSSPERHWLYPNGGGKFLFFPMWMFGIFWTLYGMWRLAS
jgi:hypothetical protein